MFASANTSANTSDHVHMILNAISIFDHVDFVEPCYLATLLPCYLPCYPCYPYYPTEAPRLSSVAGRSTEDQDELEREERRKRGLLGLSNSEKVPKFHFAAGAGAVGPAVGGENQRDQELRHWLRLVTMVM